MDRILLESLNNLADSLENLADILAKKKESSTPTTAALQAGNFEQGLRQISNSINELKQDNAKILNQQDTILKILREKRDKEREDVKVQKTKKVEKEQTTVATAKEISKEKEKSGDEQEKKSLFRGLDTRKIKDGVGAVLQIAVGIVAIGLALKIVGKVDFVSVMAISFALPFIAIAFSKIAETFSGRDVIDEKTGKSYKAKSSLSLAEIAKTSLAMVSIALSIFLTSKILSQVTPVGILQGISSIMIAGIFAVIAPKLSPLLESFAKSSFLTSMKAILLMPFVLLALSTAIYLSSQILANVKPIGLLQAATSIMIAGVFVVLATKLDKIIGAFSKGGVWGALKSIVFMPLVFMSLSIAILLSSHFLSQVQPIGLMQVFSSLAIAGIFTLASLGLGKILGAFKGVNPVAAALAAVMMPIVFVALSMAIYFSAFFLSQVKPIGLLQVITSIAISAVFVILSFGISRIIKAFDRFSMGQILAASVMIPIIFTALAFAIYIASFPLSQVNPIGILQFLTSIAISALFVVFSVAIWAMNKLTKDISMKDVLFTSFVALTMTGTIALAAWILSTTKFPQNIMDVVKFTLGFTLCLVAITGMIFALKYVKLSLTDVLKGTVMILAIAGTIYLTSKIIAAGEYEKYPSLKWSLGIAASFLVIGGAIVGLGTLITASSGLGALGIAAGVPAVLAVAWAIVKTDEIISKGIYKSFPSMEWSKTMAYLLLSFGSAVIALGALNMLGGVASTITFGLVKNPIAAGAEAVELVANSIVKTDSIISKGSYSKVIPKNWSENVGSLMTSFGKAIVFIGSLSFGDAVEEGSEAVIRIANTIVQTDKILAKGVFKGGPTQEWSKGISNALNGFSPIYSMLLKSAIIELFGGDGITAEKYSNAIKSITTSIVEAASIFDKSKASFQKGPTQEWASGMSGALKAFSPIYTYLMKGSIMEWLGMTGPKVDDFTAAIQKISLGIVSAAQLFDKYKLAFKEGPTEQWSTGISLALGAFSPLYTTLMKGSLMDWLGMKGPKIEDYEKAILTISGGIITAANNFAKNKASFKQGPTEDWSKGIGLALTAFSPIYTTLMKGRLMDWLGMKGPTVEDYQKAIITISGGIIAAAKSFSENKASFKEGPTEAWAKGISLALGAFSPIYSRLRSERIFEVFGMGNIKTTQYVEAILNISDGIIAAANSFFKNKASFKEGPTEDWAKGMSLALGAFSPVYEKLRSEKIFEFFGMGNIKPRDYVEAIEIISGGIIAAANHFFQNKASFKEGPTEDWAKGMSLALGAFSPIYERLRAEKFWSVFKLGVKTEEFTEAIKSISDGIIAAAQSFYNNKASFKEGPTEEWAKGISLALGAFSPIYYNLRKEKFWEVIGFGNIKPKDYVDAIKIISDGIIEAAKSFDSNKASFKEGPKEQWAKGISLALGAFSPIYYTLRKEKIWEVLGLGNIKPKDYVDAIKTISDGIIAAAKSFDENKASFKEGPKQAWAKGIALALGAFSPIYYTLRREKIFEVFGLGNIKPRDYVNAIEIISEGIIESAKSFEKNKASFKEGPKQEWAKGVSLALGAFSPIYERLRAEKFWSVFKLGVKTEEFTDAIKIISKGIVESAKVFQENKASFVSGPSESWAKSMSVALGAFTPVFKILADNSSWFKKNIKIDEYKTAIETISRGIVSSAQILSSSQARASYPNGPPESWSRSVSLSLGAFTPVFQILYENNSWFDKQISPESFKNAIILLSQGIVDAAGFFANMPTRYDNPPSEAWAKGVSTALGAFSPVFDILVESAGWIFSPKITGDELGTAIRVVSKGIVDAANAFGSKNVNYGKFPSEAWSKGVSSSIQAFGSVFEYLVNTSGVWTAIASLFGQDRTKDLTYLIGGIASAIELASVRFGTGNYTKIIPPAWVSGVKYTVTEFMNLTTTLVQKDVDPKSFQKISDIASYVNLASIRFSMGEYTNVIPNNWINQVKYTVLEFVKLMDDLRKNYFMTYADINIPQYITSIAPYISEISQSLTRGDYTKNIPTSWISSIKFTVVEFVKMTQEIVKSGLKAIDYRSIENLAPFLESLSKRFQKLDFKNIIPENWIKSIKFTILEFIQMTKGILKSGIEIDNYKTLETMTPFLENLAKKLEKLNFKMVIPSTWITSIKFTINEFSKIIKDLVGLKFSVNDFNMVEKMGSTLKQVSLDLSRGNWMVYPKLSWSIEVGKVLRNFYSQDLDIVKRFDNNAVSGFVNVAKTISDISHQFLKGEFTKYPGLDWAQGVSMAIKNFVNIANFGLSSGTDMVQNFFKTFGITNTDDKSVKNDLNRIIDLMIYVDKKFQQGVWTKFPSTGWVEGTILSIQKFKEMISDLAEVSLSDRLKNMFTNDPETSTITNIEKLAVSITKLSDSLKGFNDTIRELDNQKLAELRSFSTNLVLFSLMDSGQFDSMMTSLESRASVFGTLIAELEKARSEATAGSTPTSPTGPEPDSRVEDDNEMFKTDARDYFLQSLAIFRDLQKVLGSEGELSYYLDLTEDEYDMKNTGKNRPGLWSRQK